MEFKGIIARGSPVSVSLTTQNTNRHSATLSVGLDSDPQGNTNRVLAPGSGTTIELQADSDAALVILYTFDSDVEGGHLDVRVRGALRDSEAVGGDDGWTYSVE